MAAAESSKLPKKRKASQSDKLPIVSAQQSAEATTSTVYRPGNPYLNYPEKLEVLEKNDVVIVEENDSAFFECIINVQLNPTCTWHRNGIQMQDDHRTMIRKDGERQRLHLKYVQVIDSGLYILECRHLDYYISVPHRLYVSPKRNIYRVFHNSQQYSKMGVQKHLKNTRILIGQKLEMVARFVYDTKKYIWFKNNAELHDDSRTTINKLGTRATLTITDTVLSDTGIYYVMAKTDYGYFSSCADVIVGKPNEKRPLLPFVEENPPEEVEGYIGEEMRINAKVHIDSLSKIRWVKNNAIIVTDEIKQIDFGNDYIGVKIPSLKQSSAGDYQLLVCGSAISQIVQVPLRVKVTEPPPSFPTEVTVVQKLESAVACGGAQVLFECRFALEDMPYTYVVWHVGPYKVERTNSMFSVICGRGHFVLYIKRFYPCMAGEVMCELRRAHVSRASVKLSRTYAHLTCVPPYVILNSPSLSLVRKLVPSPYVRRGTELEFEGNPNPRLQDTDEAAALNEDFCLQIVICKINDEGFYYLNTTQGRDRRRVTNVEIGENVTEDRKVSTLVTWRDTKASTAFCYAIEMEQQDGTFAKTGNTHRPCFWINDLPMNRLLVFHIKEDMPLAVVEHSTINIVPLPEAIVEAPASQKPKTEAEFLETYHQTDYKIGSGSFGYVTLIEHKKTQKKYAAKLVRAKSEKRRRSVRREFDIMKSLSHPKIINLIGFYEGKKSYTVVMEYCWGGDLFDRLGGEDYIRETDVVIYVRQICEALEYLNGLGIVHMDLKPENIVCVNPNSTNIKIIDFGLAHRIADGIPRAILGTREFMAPEILELSPYECVSTSADMWSLGVITYLLLSGVLPFDANDWRQISLNIIKASYDFHDEAFQQVSRLAMNFVDKLLIRKSEDRMTATQALHHKWLKESQETCSHCMTKMRRNLRTYLEDNRRKWQSQESLWDREKDLFDFFADYP